MASERGAAFRLDLFAREAEVSATWTDVDKGHRRLMELADRHYTRQSPGSNQCLRPGVNLVLLLSDGSAAWAVWRPIPEVGRMDKLEAWECTLFRNEGARLSSTLVVEATVITHRRWGWPPKDGLITSIGVKQTAKRRSRRAAPGACFRRAGWTEFQHPSPDESKCWLRAPHPARTAKDTTHAR